MPAMATNGSDSRSTARPRASAVFLSVGPATRNRIGVSHAGAKAITTARMWTSIMIL